MEMDFNDERLIEAGLNFIAYVAAAGAIGLVYSMFSGNKRNYSTKSVEPASYAQERPGVLNSEISEFAETLSPTHHLSGIDPSEIKTEANGVRQRRSAISSGNTGSRQSRFARNRREVIELARKMLESGESASRVSDLLPLSESELNMAAIGARVNTA